MMRFFNQRSLSFKIIIFFVATAFMVAFVMRVFIGDGFSRHTKSIMQLHLQKYFEYISDEIGNPPDLKIAKKLSNRLDIKIHIYGNNLNWHSNNGKKIIHRRSRFSPEITISNPPYFINFRPYQNDLHFPWQFVISTLLAIFLILTSLYLLLRHAIKPLKNLKQGVQKIGAGNVNHRIELNHKTSSEFYDLTQSINNMAIDIENMLESKRQLLLAVSHELRTPLTRSKVALSLLKDSKLKSGLIRDINQMEFLIKNLLEAERLNERHQVLNLSATDINDVVLTILNKNYRDALIDIQLDKRIGVYPLDKIRLQFVINNLIDNALKYQNPTTEPIIIKTTQTNDTLIISIINHGNVIKTEHLKHLTEPFYRADPSRQRTMGGYGLGLYLSQKIALAHGGQFNIQSDIKNGTMARIVFAKTKNNEI